MAGINQMMVPDLAIRLSGNQPVQHPEGYRIEPTEIEPGIVFLKDDLTIEAFHVSHGAVVPAFGFRIVTDDKTVVVSGDTDYSETLLEKARGVEVLIHEVISDSGLLRCSESFQTYYHRSHTLASELARLATAARPNVLVLYHGIGGIHLTGPVERRSSPGAIRWRTFQARRVPAHLRRRGSHGPRPPGGDKVLVAYRVVGHRELEHAVEDHPAAAGAPAVEAEHELVQVAGQVRRLHRALVGAQQPALGQRDHPMHRRQERARILAAGSGRPLATSGMDIAELLEPAVARPAIGDHRRARRNVICHEGVQRGGRRIGQRQHPAPADAFRRLDLHGDAGQHLLAPGSTAGQSRLLTADVGLIHLHHAGQPVPARAH